MGEQKTKVEVNGGTVGAHPVKVTEGNLDSNNMSPVQSRQNLLLWSYWNPMIVGQKRSSMRFSSCLHTLCVLAISYYQSCCFPTLVCNHHLDYSFASTYMASFHRAAIITNSPQVLSHTSQMYAVVMPTSVLSSYLHVCTSCACIAIVLLASPRLDHCCSATRTYAVYTYIQCTCT